MKKALHYAIRHGMYGPRVVAVTLERGLRWWGRYEDTTETTNGRGDLDGRWDTPEEARAKLTEVRSVRDHFSRQRSILRSAVDQLERAEAATIKNAVTGLPQRGQGLLEARVVVRTEDQREKTRDEIAEVLNRIAVEGTTGLSEGRSLDAALDAILASAGVL